MWYEGTKWNWKNDFKLQTSTDKIPLGFIFKAAHGSIGRKKKTKLFYPFKKPITY